MLGHMIVEDITSKLFLYKHNTSKQYLVSVNSFSESWLVWMFTILYEAVKTGLNRGVQNVIGNSLIWFLAYLSTSKWKVLIFFVPFCLLGQSVHLGMGGSWSCAVLCNLWTFCHILPGLLYILLHWRVSYVTWILLLNLAESLPNMFFFVFFSSVDFCFSVALQSLCFMER